MISAATPLLQLTMRSGNPMLTPVERAWANLAAEVLILHIKEGCSPEMDDEWFFILCSLANVDHEDLRKKIDFIFGTEEDYDER